MFKHRSVRVRSIVSALIVAAATILSAASTVLAGSGGGPFPK